MRVKILHRNIWRKNFKNLLKKNNWLEKLKFKWTHHQVVEILVCSHHDPRGGWLGAQWRRVEILIDNTLISFLDICI